MRTKILGESIADVIFMAITAKKLIKKGGKRLEIEKIINNNIIRSSDELNHEVLVMGCGIGYLKKIGMEIDPEKIDKIYRLQSKQALSNLETLFTGLPLATIQATNDIVDYAKTSLGTQLSDNIYLTLADHIQFAVEREKEGLMIKNALLWEIKQFYHHEFMIGQESLDIIQQKLKINLPEDEAAFIALHLVSATQDYSGTSQAKQTMTMIKQVLSIIKYHFIGIELDEHSLHYDRFITHMKFFIQRVFSGNEIKEDDADFLVMLKQKYKEEYLCTLKIYDHFLKQHSIHLTNDEVMYLTIHIRRITQN